MDQRTNKTDAEALGQIGSFQYDQASDTVTWSDELYRLMNVPAAEPLTLKTALSFYTDPDRAQIEHRVAVALKSGEGFEMEARFIRRGEAEPRHVFLRAESTAENGKITGLKGVVQDITQRLKTEEQIQKLNKELIAKNRELASLHSELQTFNDIAANDYQETLKTLYTNLEFLIANDAKNLSNSGKAGIRKAQTAIQKMKLLTEDVISFSRIQQRDHEKRDVDLNQVIAGVIADMSEKIKEHQVDFEISHLPTVPGYPLLLSLMFHHLFDNAIKFCEPARKIMIKVGYEITHNHQSASPVPYHRVMISDNGIGFDEKHTQKIFSIFHKLHDKSLYRGSGIGLAVCKKIMALHGGTITGQSREGHGADFCCFFPV